MLSSMQRWASKHLAEISAWHDYLYSVHCFNVVVSKIIIAIFWEIVLQSLLSAISAYLYYLSIFST